MATKYVDSFTTPLKDDKGRRVATLLWGDSVQVLAFVRQFRQGACPGIGGVGGHEGALQSEPSRDLRH